MQDKPVALILPSLNTGIHELKMAIRSMLHADIPCLTGVKIVRADCGASSLSQMLHQPVAGRESASLTFANLPELLTGSQNTRFEV